jgi:hypothetical protein
MLVQIGFGKGLQPCEFGVFVVFIEEKWFWGEKPSLDITFYIYGAILSKMMSATVDKGLLEH